MSYPPCSGLCKEAHPDRPGAMLAHIACPIFRNSPDLGGRSLPLITCQSLIRCRHQHASDEPGPAGSHT